MELKDFFGEYDYALDDKNRLSIPAKYRKVMSNLKENTFIVCAIEDSCLTLFPYCNYSKTIGEKLETLPQTDDNANEIRRKFGSKSIDATLDNQGRIMVPAYFCNHAGIDHKVKVIGCTNKIELWNPETYDQFSQKPDQKSIKEELSLFRI
jgi:MraZ protein